MVQHAVVPLLFLSPFLSMESLKQAVNKPNFPMAMKAEVCIANPDATKGYFEEPRTDGTHDDRSPRRGATKGAYWSEVSDRGATKYGRMSDMRPKGRRNATMTPERGSSRYPKQEGFLKWLQLDANEPMPAYLIAMIEASWETKTFRTDMELELADLHTAICQRATEMLYAEHQKPTASAAQLRWIWQQVRTTAARYAEANLLLAQGNYAAARTVIENMPVDKELRGPEILEQQRMLSFISLLETAAGAGRGAAELSVGEVNQLKVLIADQYDRPANWISNLLCLYYDECRAPRTGGNTGGEKNLQGARNNLEEIVRNVIQLAPNPAQTWSTLTYTLIEEPINGKILVKDLFGRVVISKQMNGTQGQVVLDTRQLSKGIYLVECVSNEEMLRSDRLVVQ